ncbi:MAG: MoxR family ATPase [Alphaproteobacteria bacterium]|nr:MoxR family ATPase [Alphaproteobacteria bacterium]
MTAFQRFTGASRYISDDDLTAAVNAAIALKRPLLIKGEPGTGKTQLAYAVAEALGLSLLTWHIKSTTKAVEGLYTYDVVQRLNDARFGDGDVSNIRNYIRYGPVGQAFASPEQTVLLIDEVDKADLEFPNDLLRELDEMRFTIPELDETVEAVHRPITIITSNAEKELPDAFLRRCVFHYIAFPERERLSQIVEVHHPDLDQELIGAAMTRFYALRKLDGMRKKPSTSELLDWLLVLTRAGIPAETIAASVPFAGVLLKQEEDHELLDKRARRGR